MSTSERTRGNDGSDETPLIRLRDVHKSYFLANGEEIPILKGIDLEIRRNEFVALMGESGGGKSTLLNILGCLHALSSGEYFLEGEDIGSIKNDDLLAFVRSKKMGFVFQQFHLIGKMTALGNVALPGFYAGMDRDERFIRAREILESVGLGDRVDHKPNELSGGQQQRVSIARALVNDPEVILADEPTGALDSVTSKEIMAIFQGLKERGTTIVMVTHTPEVARYADRIIFLRDGRVVDHNYRL